MDSEKSERRNENPSGEHGIPQFMATGLGPDLLKMDRSKMVRSRQESRYLLLHRKTTNLIKY